MLKFRCRLHSTSNSNVELPVFNFRTYSDPCALFTFRSTSPFRSMFRFRACIALIRVWCVFNPVHCLYMHFDLACEQCGALDTHHLYICFAHFNSTSRCRLAFIFSFCCMRCTLWYVGVYSRFIYTVRFVFKFIFEQSASRVIPAHSDDVSVCLQIHILYDVVYIHVDK
jgi:hypothetical protein